MEELLKIDENTFLVMAVITSLTTLLFIVAGSYQHRQRRRRAGQGAYLPTVPRSGPRGGPPKTPKASQAPRLQSPQSGAGTNSYSSTGEAAFFVRYLGDGRQQIIRPRDAGGGPDSYRWE